jgi:hypothetical protein
VKKFTNFETMHVFGAGLLGKHIFGQTKSETVVTVDV